MVKRQAVFRAVFPLSVILVGSKRTNFLSRLAATLTSNSNYRLPMTLVTPSSPWLSRRELSVTASRS